MSAVPAGPGWGEDYAAPVPLRIRHVIPTVGGSAPAQLVEVQDVTFRSIERALRCVDPDVDVDVRAVRFPDEPVDAPWLTDVPILERSILDLGEFTIPRRLPLLPDVLSGLGDPSEYDVAVFTNVDIAIQPLFYDLISGIVDDGYDAFTINRRTVFPRFARTSLARLAATGGAVHPGHDCFVMATRVVGQLDVGDVALGVRWVARTLLWELQLLANRYRTFGNLHATFHVGDDRTWVDPALHDYEVHNETEAKALIERAIERWGRDRVERLVGVAPFLRAIDTDTEPQTRPPRLTKVAITTRPMSAGSHRLVFTASPGRSGSEFLSQLLGAAARTSAGHERQPTMTGPWLRRVAYDDSASSYQDRLVKVDALRSELGRMPAGWTYVDTSHMFVKTFADVVFDEFQHEQISVIVLRRDPIETARSFFELDYFGPRPRAWINWMISPTAPYSAFRLDPEEVEDQFDLIFGYLVDIEVRTQQLRDRTPAVGWIDARLDEIATPQGSAELFSALRLTRPAGIGDLLEERVNRRGRRKSEIDQHVPIEHVRDRMADFVCRHAGRREVELFLRNHPVLEAIA